MQASHIEQARHNAAFLLAIEKQFPKQFYDWKITVCLYIALHYLQAFARLKRVQIGTNHRDMMDNSNPNDPTATNPLSQKAFDAYRNLFHLSHGSRYQVVKNQSVHLSLLGLDAAIAKKELETIKNYLVSQGLSL
jgi:hypothetical protein